MRSSTRSASANGQVVHHAPNGRLPIVARGSAVRGRCGPPHAVAVGDVAQSSRRMVLMNCSNFPITDGDYTSAVAADVDFGVKAKREGMAKPGLAKAPNHGGIAHGGMLSVITTARLQACGLLREYMEVSIHAPLSGLGVGSMPPKTTVSI